VKNIINHTDERFYVYVHSRLTTGEPFYVGKGTGRRATNPVNRSNHWKSIVKKDGGFHLSYVANNIEDELSLLLECELIAKYRSNGVKLINQTDGGDGLSGYIPKRKGIPGKKLSEESKKRMSLAQQNRTVWPCLTEEHKKKIGDFHRGKKHCLGHKASEETKAKLSAIHKGCKHTLGHRLSAEHKYKLSQVFKNKTQQEKDAISKKLSESMRKIWAKRKTE